MSFYIANDRTDRFHTSQTVMTNLLKARNIIGPNTINVSGGIININGSSIIIDASTICIEATSSLCIETSGNINIDASKICLNANLVCIDASTFIVYASNNTCLNASHEIKLDASLVLINSSLNVTRTINVGEVVLFSSVGGGILSPNPSVTATEIAGPHFTATLNTRFGIILIGPLTAPIPPAFTSTLTITNSFSGANSIVLITYEGLISGGTAVPPVVRAKSGVGAITIQITNMSLINNIPNGRTGTIYFAVIG